MLLGRGNIIDCAIILDGWPVCVEQTYGLLKKKKRIELEERPKGAGLRIMSRQSD